MVIINFFIVLCMFFGKLSAANVRFKIDEDDDGEVIDLSHMGSSIFGEPNEAVGKILENWDPSHGNAEEQGTYGEGDILIPMKKMGRSGISFESRRWKGGVIPYVIADSMSKSSKQMIHDAFEEYRSQTCINFVPRNSEDDYIKITNNFTGCYSAIGRMRGEQIVNLQEPKCFSKIGTVMHELLHTIGYFHEQNRFDRDEFVSINWDNVQQGGSHNFQKKDVKSVTHFNVAYDYESIMHYSSNAFSRNGKDTMEALKRGGEKMGQRIKLSDGDLLKIGRMYNCTIY